MEMGQEANVWSRGQPQHTKLAFVIDTTLISNLKQKTGIKQVSGKNKTFVSSLRCLGVNFANSGGLSLKKPVRI